MSAALQAAAQATWHGACQCEHGSHFADTDVAGSGPVMVALAGHAYLAAPAGPRRAEYIGPVCETCADGHLADYVIWQLDAAQAAQLAHAQSLAAQARREVHGVRAALPEHGPAREAHRELAELEELVQETLDKLAAYGQRHR